MEVIKQTKPIEIIAVQHQKFKNVVLSLRCFNKLQPKENTKLALLSMLISDRNQKYQTKKEIRYLKDMLYGASLRCACYGYGDYQTLELRLTAISEKTIHEPLQYQQLNAIRDFFYYPLINQQTFEEAKRNLRNKLLRQIENPMNFAIKRSFEIMGEDTNLGISTQGSLNDIDEITLDEIISFHHDLMKKGKLILYVIGNFDEGYIQTVSNTFSNHEPFYAKTPYQLFQSKTPFQKVDEKAYINQASLVMSFQTNVSIDDLRYYPLRLACILLGQLPTSLLFQEVREKASLCYNISSSLVAFNGLLMISTSLDKKNIDQAIELILKQVEHLKSGNFEDELIEGAKELLKSNLDAIEDDEFSILSFLSDSRMLNVPMDKNFLYEKYVSVNKNEIIDAVKELELVLTYTLSGENHEENI